MKLSVLFSQKLKFNAVVTNRTCNAYIVADRCLCPKLFANLMFSICWKEQGRTCLLIHLNKAIQFWMDLTTANYFCPRKKL